MSKRSKSNGGGYRNPPQEKRFKPGQSGNPHGRPKRTSDLDRMIVEAGEKTVSAAMGNGVRTNLTTQEAMAHQLVNQALKGRLAAIRKIFRIARPVKATQMAITLIRTIIVSPSNEEQDEKT